MLHLLLALGTLSAPPVGPIAAPASLPRAVHGLAQQPSKRTSTGTEEEDPHYEQFLETLRFYENALEGYDFDVRQLRKRKAPKEEYPIPPEYTYFDAFKDLADKGSVWSMAWLVENLSVRHREEEDLVRETQAWHHRMFEAGVNSNAILRPIERLPLAWKALGTDFILEELSTLFEKSKHPGVRGNALWAQGRSLILASEENGDAQARADALTLYGQLLDGFPQSPLAAKAAMTVYPSVMESFDRAVAEWIGQVEALSKEGVPFTEWPERPGSDFEHRFETLVRGQALQANHWWEGYWAASKREHEELGTARALCGDALRIGSLSSVSSQEWLTRMLELLVPLVRTFQAEPWFDSWLASATEQFIRRRMPSKIVIPGLERALEVVTVRAARLRLTYVLGDAHLRTLPKPDLARAEALFREVHEALAQEETDSSLVQLGEFAGVLVEHAARARVGADVSWCSGPSPYGETINLGDYVGKVLLLDFFAFTSSGAKANAPKIRDLRDRFAARGFEVVGLCSDGYERRLFRGRAKEFGIDWPCISSFRVRGSVWSDWFVIGFPKYIVVGADGRIVGRDLNFKEAEALVQRELGDEEGTPSDE